MGAMLIDKRAIQAATEMGAGDWLFYSQQRAMIFRAIIALFASGKPADQLTVADYLRTQGNLERAGGEEHLAALAADVRSTANVSYHIESLREKHAMRAILLMCRAAEGHILNPQSELGPGDIINKMDQCLADARDKLVNKSLTLSERVHAWVKETTGEFRVDEIYRDLCCKTDSERANVRNVICRLNENREIERTGKSRAQYRLVDSSLVELDWRNAKGYDNQVYVNYPLCIEEYFVTMPKNIILVAGAPNSGKTAFLMRFAQMNMMLNEIFYFSSEMSADEFKSRIDAFGLPNNHWDKLHVYERVMDFADVVRPNGINIIDYLELTDEFYKIGGFLNDIFRKLDRGIAVVALQMNHGAQLGLGGTRGSEKPRLYLTLDSHICKIIKAKNRRVPSVNFDGMQCEYKLVDGCTFIKETEWAKE